MYSHRVLWVLACLGHGQWSVSWIYTYYMHFCAPHLRFEDKVSFEMWD